MAIEDTTDFSRSKGPPKMWNFTVRGLLVPNLSEIEHLFQSEKTVKNSQRPLKNVKAKEMFIGK